MKHLKYLILVLPFSLWCAMYAVMGMEIIPFDVPNLIILNLFDVLEFIAY